MQAYGRGVATISAQRGTPLEVWYADFGLGELPGGELDQFAGDSGERLVRFETVQIAIDLDAPPDGVADAYLRLHLLSARLVKPHGLNVDGILASLRWSRGRISAPCTLTTCRRSGHGAGSPDKH